MTKERLGRGRKGGHTLHPVKGNKLKTIPIKMKGEQPITKPKSLKKPGEITTNKT